MGEKRTIHILQDCRACWSIPSNFCSTGQEISCKSDLGPHWDIASVGYSSGRDAALMVPFRETGLGAARRRGYSTVSAGRGAPPSPFVETWTANAKRVLFSGAANPTLLTGNRLHWELLLWAFFSACTSHKSFWRLQQEALAGITVLLRGGFYNR